MVITTRRQHTGNTAAAPQRVDTNCRLLGYVRSMTQVHYST